MVDACQSVSSSRHPTELELAVKHLNPRAHRIKTNESNFIHEADVYDVDPADLTAKFPPAHATDGVYWYFFSPVRNQAGRRRVRSVKSADNGGCWHSEAGVKAVEDEHKRRVGHRQFFSFTKKGDDGKRYRTGWIMVEIGLDHEPNDVVLCKVYKTPRKPSGVMPSAMMEIHGEKRKMTDDDAELPPQQRRRLLAEEETQEDGSEENSGESSTVPSTLADVADLADDDDVGRLEETTSSDDDDDDCVMLPDPPSQGEVVSTQRETLPNTIGDGTVADDDNCRHQRSAVPDLNIDATMSEEDKHEDHYARNGRQHGSTLGSITKETTSTSNSTMAATERITSTRSIPDECRRRHTLKLHMVNDGMEQQRQQAATPAWPYGGGGRLQWQQGQRAPCFYIVVRPCAAHSSLRYGTTYRCGCRVTGSFSKS
uniref:NAC domain-containing protein n=1 Tax=Leersia perrieri TaxID=77586 RepID=A0A0D9XC60_9ORYZ